RGRGAFRVGGAGVPRARARGISGDCPTRAAARGRRVRRGRRRCGLRPNLAGVLGAFRARMTLATEGLLDRLAASPERFPGALLLTGPSEARLERESRRLAARLLCPGDDPDTSCRSCRRVTAGLHPDFLSVEPEGVQIRVDRVREALAFSAGRPYESARRVARIARADLLGVEAGNALLKSLEEPGERF